MKQCIKFNVFLFIIIYYFSYAQQSYIPQIGSRNILKIDNYKYVQTNARIEEKEMAIITFFLKYPFKYIDSFLKSIDNVKYKGKVIIFTDITVKFNYSYLNIQQLLIEKLFPFYSLKNILYPISKDTLYNYIPINCSYFSTLRYYLLNVWLKFYYSKFKYIYFIDGRDVLFQLNPSMWNYNKGVYLSKENKKVKLKNSKLNLKWIYNFKIDKSYMNNGIINGGSIFGSSNEITLFISQMIYMLKYLHLTCNNDQGALMYFYYSHPKFQYPVNVNYQGYGYCLSLTDLYCDSIYSMYCNYNIHTNDTIIRNLDGSIPIILHGLERWRCTNNYSRRKEYLNFINRNYPYYPYK